MWVELFRTRHYDGALRELRRLTGRRLAWSDLVETWAMIGGREACSVYQTRDGRYRVVALVDRRGHSVRVAQEWVAGAPA